MKQHKDNMKKINSVTSWRFIFVSVFILFIIAVLIYRLYNLETKNSSFLRGKGRSESNHTIDLPHNRGTIYDRNGVPLAISTNLYAIILDIKTLAKETDQLNLINQLKIKKLTTTTIKRLISNYPNKRYYIAAKYVTPAKALALKKLKISGIHVKQENRTYYPRSNSVAPLIGFTNSKNQGQDGLLLSQNKSIKSNQGSVRVITDGKKYYLLYRQH